MIPKIIHQIGNDLPTSWKEQNPSCAYILWTEQKLKNWRFHTKKPDRYRYEILFHMGGVFVDNIPCQHPLKDNLFQYECATLANSSIVAAQPRCELIWKCVEEGLRPIQAAQIYKLPIKIFSEIAGPPVTVCRRLGILCHFRYKMKPSATQLVRSR